MLRSLVKVAVALIVLRRVSLFLRLVLARRSKPVITCHRADKRLAHTEQVFRDLYAEGLEKGSQITVYVDGRVALDMYGGRDAQSVFRPDQVVTVFSCTKVIESLTVAMLVDRGKLKYGDLVVKYIPGFYDPGLTVAELMQHRAGAAGIEKQVTMAELSVVLASPEKTAAFVRENLSKDNKPGEPRKQRYHAYTRGIFTAVIVHAVTGLSIEEFVQREIVQPLRLARPEVDVQLHIGVPDSKQSRVAQSEDGYTIVAQVPDFLMGYLGVKTMVRQLFYASDDEFHRTWLEPYEEDFIKNMFLGARNMNTVKLVSDLPLTVAAVANSPVQRAMPLFSSNGASNAPSLAAILNELAVGGGIYLSKAGYEAAVKPAETLFDQALRVTVTFSQCGFGLDRFGAGWYGWAGAGGSMLVWSPESRVVFSYVPTCMNSRLAHVNGERLLNAIRKDMGIP